MKFLKMKHFWLVSLLLCLTTASIAQNQFYPGKVWKDADGNPINAHGGCVVFYNGAYYLFGEDRTGQVSNGVSCYKSKNLYTWKKVGLALKTTGEKRKDYNDIAEGRTLERPKVIFNKKTGKWVLWAHWETGEGYAAARVCVAISDNIEGPYKLYRTFRPNSHDSRDQTLFKDFDGNAYHFCSTDMNTNMNVALLREDYLEPTSTETKILKGEKYEAPAIFRVGDIYYGLFSGCTGWDPNPGHSAYTFDILGNWTTGYNFAVDPKKLVTYRSQSAYVLKVEGRENAYIYIGDRWNPDNVGASEMVWLPISMRSGYPTVRWYDSWGLNIFDSMYRYKRAKEIVPGHVYVLLEKRSNRIVSKTRNGFTITNDNDSINLNLNFIPTGISDVYKLKDIKTGKYITSLFGSLRLTEHEDAVSQNWRLHIQPDGYYKIENEKSHKYLTVSGSSTFNGTNLYLAEKSTSVPQDFAIYFDSEKYEYKDANIFSQAYFKNNMRRMKEQEKLHSRKYN